MKERTLKLSSCDSCERVDVIKMCWGFTWQQFLISDKLTGLGKYKTIYFKVSRISSEEPINLSQTVAIWLSIAIHLSRPTHLCILFAPALIVFYMYVQERFGESVISYLFLVAVLGHWELWSKFLAWSIILGRASCYLLVAGLVRFG